MLAYLTRVFSSVLRSAPDASALIPYIRDSSNPLQRDLRAMTVEQLATVLGTSASSGGGAGSFSATEMAALVAEAAAYSEEVTRRSVMLTQPTAQLVLWLGYGQSNSVGFECWPALTKTAPLDCFMIGPSVHAADRFSSSWAPMFGDTTLRPLIGTVRSGTASGVLDEAQQAALLGGASNPGETPLEGFAAHLRREWLRARGKPDGDPNNRWVFAACGVGGQSAASLSVGSDPEFFNRIRGAITTAKAIAAANGWTFAVGGMLFSGGEADYGLRTPYADYLATLTQLIADFRSYAVSQTGQSGVIPVFISQTGGGPATADNVQLQVARAQIALSRTVPGVYIAASNAPVPDKGIHLTANGARWVGSQQGKVAARALIDGVGWECTRPLRWLYRDRTLAGPFHLPVAPLRFCVPYANRTPQVGGASAGLYLVDSLGTLPVIATSIYQGRVLVATLGRGVTGTLQVWQGAEASLGGVFVSDSDTTRLVSTYDYAADSGQSTDENIPALVGLSYPAANVGLADVQTATAA